MNGITTPWPCPAHPADASTRCITCPIRRLPVQAKQTSAIASLQMKEHYRRWIHDWEARMTSRDNNRVVRPFEWGLDWTTRWPGIERFTVPRDATDKDPMLRYMSAVNDHLVENSDDFFGYTTPTDFRIEHRKVELFHTGSEPPKKQLKDQWGKFLRFTSPVDRPIRKTIASTRAGFRRMVVARWCCCRNGTPTPSVRTRCAAFQSAGHCGPAEDHAVSRYPPARGITRADYAVSANVGRTIDATRQGIADIRACLDWLESAAIPTRHCGHQSGFVLCVLGQCRTIPRIRVNASTTPPPRSATWSGPANRRSHIRQGIEPVLTQAELAASGCASAPSCTSISSTAGRRSR